MAGFIIDINFVVWYYNHVYLAIIFCGVIMKKFTKILICLILCVFGLGLFGCGNNNNEGNKGAVVNGIKGDVSGNGGLAVQKGGHIYFVNGFQPYGESKRYASQKHAGIMLAKLSENGELVVNENGEIATENLVHFSNKLAGFEATDLTIFGNYLYFTSHNQQDDSKIEDWGKGWVDFNRVKLDGSGEVETIYKSTVTAENLKFKWYENDGKVNLMVFETENKKLFTINTKGEKKKTIKDVSDVYFADNYNEVFYVQSSEDNSATEPKTNYTVYKYNAVSTSVVEFKQFGTTSVTIKFVENGFVYILNGSNLFRYEIANSNTEKHVLTNFGTDKTIKVIPGENVIVVASKDGSNMIFEYYENGSREPSVNYIVDKTASINFVGFANGCIVYVDAENNVKTLSYANRANGAQVETVANISDLSTTYFDVDGSFMYFYKTVGSKQYLHRLVVDNGPSQEEFVGVYLEADIPEVEEEE